jgi:uncharacterized membrane protein YvlD (DUF360 family)
MVNILISWVALTFAFWVASKVLRGLTIKGKLVDHLIVSAIFGALAWLVGWLLTTVIVIGTFGLGLLVPFLVQLVVITILIVVTDKLTTRLRVNGWLTAFLAALIVAVVGAVTAAVLDRIF